MAPCSRMRLVSARVSTPATPTIPLAVSQSTQASGQVAFQAVFLISRTMMARECTSVRLEQVVGGSVVADHGIGEGDHLPVVGGVGGDLLVTGHAGVEDYLPQDLTRCAETEAREYGAVAGAPRSRERPPDTSGLSPGARESARPAHHRQSHPPGESLAQEGAVPTLAPERRGRDLPGLGQVGHAEVGGRARGQTWARSGRAPGRARRTSPRRDGPGTALPVSTRPVWSAAKAVSRPVLPLLASSMGTSFSWGAWGAWSVPMQSMVPSASAATRASRSSADRIGGLTLRFWSKLRSRSSVKSRCSGVASAVTGSPSVFGTTHQAHAVGGREVLEVDEGDAYGPRLSPTPPRAPWPGPPPGASPRHRRSG